MSIIVMSGYLDISMEWGGVLACRPLVCMGVVHTLKKFPKKFVQIAPTTPHPFATGISTLPSLSLSTFLWTLIPHVTSLSLSLNLSLSWITMLSVGVWLICYSSLTKLL